MPRAGVLAVQGDFDLHVAALIRAGAPPESVALIRTPAHLAGVDRLIVPGGESSTVGLLLERYGLGAAIKERAAGGMPVWGTCMGMILMAAEVDGPGQYTLGLLDITVRRNAFGAQVHSFEDEVSLPGIDQPVTAVFIRAPVITRLGSGVSEFGAYNGASVGARNGRLLGTSFHPELTEDTRLHRFFLDL
ncbi:MAG: pyridoxal 5'-phosphate synthase glutaminase subunit PdxT [Fimbriimonadaceae bacterium]